MSKCLVRALLITVVFAFFINRPVHSQIITTVIGNGTGGYTGDGGPATAAEISIVPYVYVDTLGNIYFSDQSYRRVRRINTADTVSTFAGTGSIGFSGDGTSATLAKMSNTYGIVSDAAGNIYISDVNNYRIREVDHSGIINTIAGVGTAGFYGDGGPATSAKFNGVFGVTIDRTGNLFLDDYGNARIRKISPAIGGVITTIAGGGPGGLGDGGLATAATLANPYDVAVDGIGNIYIADYGNNRIRKVDASNIISTIAGNGTGGYSGDNIAATVAEIYNPTGVSVDGCGNIYIADKGNNRIRKVDVVGIITTVTGNGTAAFGGDGAIATSGLINTPSNIRTDKKGNLYITDEGNSRIRRVSSTNRSPYFVRGHSQNLTVCSDSTATINTLLAAIDSDQNQGETWSILSPPTHGTLTASYTTISTGGTITPTSLTLSAGGYIGSDSFKVVISDCNDLHDTTIVYVTAKACPLSISAIHQSFSVIKIFPNPNQGSFNLLVTSAGDEAHIVIHDLVGEQVKEFLLAANTLTGIQLNVAPGIYYCNIVTIEGNYIEKVFIYR